MVAREKKLLGFILGHPLDDYALKLNIIELSRNLKGLESIKNRDLTFAGIITDVQHKIDKRGNPYGVVLIEDFSIQRSLCS